MNRSPWNEDMSDHEKYLTSYLAGQSLRQKLQNDRSQEAIKLLGRTVLFRRHLDMMGFDTVEPWIKENESDDQAFPRGDESPPRSTI